MAHGVEPYTQTSIPILTTRPARRQRELTIEGGMPLRGVFRASGAKNAALPLIASALLTQHPVTLHNVPRVKDVLGLLEIVTGLGTKVNWLSQNTVRLHTPKLTSVRPDAALSQSMRASFELFGALLARAGAGEVPMPGGCNLGPRPVDQHIEVFKGIGISLNEENGVYRGKKFEKSSGTHRFGLKTVGGTRNAIMASALRTETVVLENALIEPEVMVIIDFLNSIGANIRQEGPSTIVIEGVEELRGGEFTVIPDRMDAGTFMLATVASRGNVMFEGVHAPHMTAVLNKIREAGFRVTEHSFDRIEIDATNTIGRPVNVDATEFPGIPTDLQPQFAAMLATIPGTSTITDKVYFGGRFAYPSLIRKFGPEIRHVTGENHATIYGTTSLYGAPTRATDIRTGAALLIASVAASGTSYISGLEHIERGYENIVEKLRSVGASVRLS